MSKKKADNQKPFVLITEMTNLEAKAYFRESKNYVSFDLPPYFSFDEVLLYANSILIKKSLKQICIKDSKGNPKYPGNFQDVNRIILSNKDGGFAWRPMQIIHPVLYGDLVNIMTVKKSWKEVTNLFERRKKSSVECISIPLKSNTDESNRAVQVNNWWDKIEQESLRKALDYKFMFQTDISNCYSSIYTHSIEWAICPGGRLKVKADRAAGIKYKNLGTEIDFRIRQMNQNQTIGIPQGSTLMDFIAEIVLAATDIELSEEIRKTLPEGAKFSILRYRDDYRIFTEEYRVGHSIMKILSSVLHKWNMKMNTSKTSETSDIISSSIKPEKMEEIYTAPIKHSYQKAAMRIYILSKKRPNSGLVAKNLIDFFDSIQKIKKPRHLDYEVIVAIITMVAYYSPKYMPQVASIISMLIEKSEETLDRKVVISKIIDKFSEVPNTDFIDVWLQRITDTGNIHEYDFGSAITKVAVGKEDNSLLWNSDWLIKTYRDPINLATISKLPDELEKGVFTPVIEREEFELYRRDDYDR